MKRTQAQKDNVSKYAEDHGLPDWIASTCTSEAEVDACVKCYSVAWSWTSAYYGEKDRAPHNPTRNRTQYHKQVTNATEASEWRTFRPLNSRIKEVYRLCMDEIKEILIDSGVGKVRIKILMHDFDEIIKDHENIEPPVNLPRFLDGDK